MPLTSAEKRQLDDQGYLVLPAFIPPDFRDALHRRIEALFAEEGDAAGSEFKPEPQSRRLANLVNKDALFRQAITVPRLLETLRHVLGPEIKLSSLNARSADPYQTIPQPLHVDMSALPDDNGFWVCNSVWMLDDFTPDNGSLRVVPGTHRSGRLPKDALEDPLAPHPDEVLLTGEAGTVVVMNSHLWHGGTANRTAAPRTAMHAFYCRRDRPQQQYQKQLLSPDLQQRLSPELCHLLALDDPLNDQLATQPTVRSGFLK